VADAVNPRRPEGAEVGPGTSQTLRTIDGPGDAGNPLPAAHHKLPGAICESGRAEVERPRVRSPERVWPNATRAESPGAIRSARACTSMTIFSDGAEIADGCKGDGAPRKVSVTVTPSPLTIRALCALGSAGRNTAHSDGVNSGLRFAAERHFPMATNLSGLAERGLRVRATSADHVRRHERELVHHPAGPEICRLRQHDRAHLGQLRVHDSRIDSIPSVANTSARWTKRRNEPHRAVRTSPSGGRQRSAAVRRLRHGPDESARGDRRLQSGDEFEASTERRGTGLSRFRPGRLQCRSCQLPSRRLGSLRRVARRPLFHRRV